MVLNQKINSTAQDVIAVINLAKNTALTQKSVALCANNGNNNCIHGEKWSESGANLLTIAFTEEGVQTIKVPGPIVYRIEVIEIPNPAAAGGTNQNPYVVDSNDPVVRALLRMVLGSKKTSVPKRGAISNDVAVQCRDVNCALAGYAAGYLKWTGGTPGYFVDTTKFVSTGKGKLVKTKERYNPPLYWIDEVMHVTETWVPATPGQGVTIKVWDGDNEDEVLNGGHFYGICFTEWKDLNHYTTGQPAAPPATIKKTIVHKEQTYIEQQVPVPPRLVFNPKKDSNNNIVDGDDEEGIVYRFNEVEKKTKVEVNSTAKTLIFLQNNTLNKIDETDSNKLKLAQDGAVITVSDTVRGIGKHSKKICLNVLGKVEVVNGDKDCIF